MLIWRKGAELLKSENLVGLSLLILGSAVLLVVAVNILIHNLQFYSSVITTDLGQDYHAATALRSGNTVYDGINHHVPFVAVLSIPLTFLEYRNAFLLWGVLSIILLFVCIYIVVYGLELRLGLGCLILPGLILSWYPIVSHIALGQWSLIIAALIFGSWLALKRGRDGLAGTLLGIAAAIKLFPGIFGLYLLAQRRWRGLGYMVLGFSSCVIVSLLVVGFDDFGSFIYSDMPANGSNCLRYPLNHSVWGMTYRLFSSNGYVVPLVDVPAIALVAATILCLLILVVLFVGMRNAEDKNNNDIGYAATAVAMLMISPVTWQHAMVILVLPLGILLVLSNNLNSPMIRITSICIFVLTSIHDMQIAEMIVNASNRYSPKWYWGISLLGPITAMAMIFGILTKQMWNYRKSYKTSCNKVQ